MSIITDVLTDGSVAMLISILVFSVIFSVLIFSTTSKASESSYPDSFWHQNWGNGCRMLVCSTVLAKLPRMNTAAPVQILLHPAGGIQLMEVPSR